VITIAGFNSALDRSMDAAELVPGAVNRVHDVRTLPGGKGVHVALTVAALGEKVQLVGLVDAAQRTLFTEFLGERGVIFHGIESAIPIRTCLAIRDQGGLRTTEILEPGPAVAAPLRQEMCAQFLALARDSSLAVLSGSLPPGFATDTYAQLVTTLRAAGLPVFVDASGALLDEAIAARPFLVKPNREEGEALLGAKIDGPPSAAAAARALATRGVELVVQSLGAEGAVAVDRERAVHARVPAGRVVNPVGSGDCLLGGMAVGIVRKMRFEEALALGVACGTANARSRDTGLFARADVETLLAQVEVAPI
jgi:1-phosphofructokinase family hexose kinase